MKHNRREIENIALEVQIQYNMGGLADGLYLDFATDVAIKYCDRMKHKHKKKLLKAYNLGFKDAIAGDTVMNLDYQTNKQVLKRITKKNK